MVALPFGVTRTLTPVNCKRGGPCRIGADRGLFAALLRWRNDRSRRAGDRTGTLASYVFSAVWERYLAECRSSVAPSFNGHGSDGQEGVAWFERSTFRTALSVLSHARCGGRVSPLVPFHLACPRRPSEPTPGRPRQKRGSSAS